MPLVASVSLSPPAGYPPSSRGGENGEEGAKAAGTGITQRPDTPLAEKMVLFIDVTNPSLCLFQIHVAAASRPTSTPSQA